MSRIGLKAITIPAGVKVQINGNNIDVTGKHGNLKLVVPKGISVKMEGDTINVARESDIRQVKMLHGTVRANLANLILGVSEGFTQELELVGVGYRVTLEGNNLSLSIGYKHLVKYPIPAEVKVEVPSQTSIKIWGIDKQRVGLFASSVRALKPPEPYKGKGIRYLGERVRKKEVKTAVS